MGNEDEEFTPLIAMTTAVLLLALSYICILCYDLLYSHGYFQSCRKVETEPRQRTDADTTMMLLPVTTTPLLSHTCPIEVREGEIEDSAQRNGSNWDGFIMVDNCVYEPWSPGRQHTAHAQDEVINHKQVVTCEVHENKDDILFGSASIISLSSSESESDVSRSNVAMQTVGHTASSTDCDVTTSTLGRCTLLVKEPQNALISSSNAIPGHASKRPADKGNGAESGVPRLSADALYVSMSSNCRPSRSRTKSAQECTGVSTESRHWFMSERSSSFRWYGSQIAQENVSSSQYIEMSSECSSARSSVRTNEDDIGSNKNPKPCTSPRIRRCGINKDFGGQYINLYSDSESARSSNTRPDSALTTDSRAWSIVTNAASTISSVLWEECDPRRSDRLETEFETRRCFGLRKSSNLSGGIEGNLGDEYELMSACAALPVSRVKKSGVTPGKTPPAGPTSQQKGGSVTSGERPPAGPTKQQKGGSVTSGERPTCIAGPTTQQKGGSVTSGERPPAGPTTQQKGGLVTSGEIPPAGPTKQQKGGSVTSGERPTCIAGPTTQQKGGSVTSGERPPAGPTTQQKGGSVTPEGRRQDK